MSIEANFKLRYVGHRFVGARLPVDMLSDLPAFKTLLVAFAKDEWRSRHATRQRLPKGFDQSLTFDLVALEDGSAIPKLAWNRDTAQVSLPGFSDELETIVDSSYHRIVKLVEDAAADRFPKSLSSEHIRALNQLGSGLREHERIEFLGSQDRDGNVIYLDAYRRKKLITHVRETYQTRYDGVGQLLTNSAEGFIIVDTAEHGNLRIPVSPEQIIEEFDGNLNADVQFELQVELDSQDRFRSVVGVYDVGLIDAQVGADLLKRRERLTALSELPEGWLDGEGEKISTAAIAQANRLLSRRPYLSSVTRMFPTLNGGVLFEFVAGGWDYSLEFGPDGDFELFGIEVDGDDELEPTPYAAISDEFLAIFDRRVGL